MSNRYIFSFVTYLHNLWSSNKLKQLLSISISGLAHFQTWALESNIFAVEGTRLTPHGNKITSNVWEGTKTFIYHLTANFPLHDTLPCLQAFLCSLHVYQNILCLYYMNLKNSWHANTDRSYYKWLSKILLFSVLHICSNVLRWHSFYLRSQDKHFTFSYPGRNFTESAYILMIQQVTCYFMRTSNDDVNTIKQRYPSTTTFKSGLQTKK